MNIRIILHLFGVVFVFAKIFGVGPVADWSWIWVVAPFLLMPAIGLTFIFLYLSFHIPLYVFSAGYRRRYDVNVAIRNMRGYLKR